jgi:hypothetical protein
MEIDDNLLAISKCIFQERKKWEFVSNQQKEKWFFIINRLMSKKYPEKSQLLNLKVIDKVSALDLWYHFMLNKPYPNWFWSKSEKAEKSDISEKEYKLLLLNLRIKDIDLDYLIEHHIEFIKEELKYYKDLDKNNK